MIDYQKNRELRPESVAGINRPYEGYLCVDERQASAAEDAGLVDHAHREGERRHPVHHRKPEEALAPAELGVRMERVLVPGEAAELLHLPLRDGERWRRELLPLRELLEVAAVVAHHRSLTAFPHALQTLPNFTAVR